MNTSTDSRKPTVKIVMSTVSWWTGWLFTLGYAELGFWEGLWAVIVWPFYLGVTTGG